MLLLLSHSLGLRCTRMAAMLEKCQGILTALGPVLPPPPVLKWVIMIFNYSSKDKLQGLAAAKFSYISVPE